MTAPRAYLDGTADAANYDARVSYEAILDWFRQSRLDDPRSTYKATVLQAAVDQNRRGYCAVPDLVVTKFWNDYWRLAVEEFPGLAMKKPGLIPAGSDWPQFRSEKLGVGWRIVHKLERGVVDLEIRLGGRTTVAVLEQTLLGTDLVLTASEKTAFVRAGVSPVDRFRSLAEQIDTVRTGLLAATRLVAFAALVEERTRELPVVISANQEQLRA